MAPNGRNVYKDYKKCGKMVWSDAQKALAMAKYVKNVLNVEFKQHVTKQTLHTVSSIPHIDQLTNIAQPLYGLNPILPNTPVRTARRLELC